MQVMPGVRARQVIEHPTRVWGGYLCVPDEGHWLKSSGYSLAELMVVLAQSVPVEMLLVQGELVSGPPDTLDYLPVCLVAACQDSPSASEKYLAWQMCHYLPCREGEPLACWH